MTGIKMEKNKNYCIDFMEGIKQLEDNSIDLVITDPPYFFETRGKGFAKERDYLKKGLKSIGVNNKKDIITEKFLKELIRITKKINIFIFCNKAQILKILKFANENKLSFELIPFCKTAPMPLSNNQWLPDREWGVHLFKSCSVKGSYKTKRGFFVSTNYKDEKIKHPCPKPVEIMKKLIINLSKEGDLVLDCFIGSGATAIACKQLKRDFIGFDINEDYIKLTEGRLSQKSLP